jgi:hypothetical protein
MTDCGWVKERLDLIALSRVLSGSLAGAGSPSPRGNHHPDRAGSHGKPLLPEDEASRVEEHLEACATCREALETEKRLVEAIRLSHHLESLLSPDLTDRVLAGAREKQRRSSRRTLILSSMTGLGLAAAVLLAVMTLVMPDEPAKVHPDMGRGPNLTPLSPTAPNRTAPNLTAPNEEPPPSSPRREPPAQGSAPTRLATLPPGVGDADPAIEDQDEAVIAQIIELKNRIGSGILENPSDLQLDLLLQAGARDEPGFRRYAHFKLADYAGPRLDEVRELVLEELLRPDSDEDALVAAFDSEAFRSISELPVEVDSLILNPHSATVQVWLIRALRVRGENERLASLASRLPETGAGAVELWRGILEQGWTLEPEIIENRARTVLAFKNLSLSTLALRAIARHVGASAALVLVADEFASDSHLDPALLDALLFEVSPAYFSRDAAMSALQSQRVERLLAGVLERMSRTGAEGLLELLAHLPWACRLESVESKIHDFVARHPSPRETAWAVACTTHVLPSPTAANRVRDELVELVLGKDPGLQLTGARALLACEPNSVAPSVNLLGLLTRPDHPGGNPAPEIFLVLGRIDGDLAHSLIIKGFEHPHERARLCAYLAAARCGLSGAEAGLLAQLRELPDDSRTRSSIKKFSVPLAARALESEDSFLDRKDLDALWTILRSSAR